MPRVYIISDSFGSSDDDPFASKEEDKELESDSDESGVSLDGVPDFDEMK